MKAISVLLPLLLSAPVPSEPSVSRILDESLASHAYCRRVSFTYSSSDVTVWSDPGELPRKSTNDGKIARRDESLHTTEMRTYSIGGKGAEYHHRKAASKDFGLFYTLGPNAVVYATTKRTADSLAGSLGYLPFTWSMDGFYNGCGTMPIQELVLKQGKGTTARAASYENEPCHVVESSTPNGKITLWLLKNRGNAIKKLEVLKGPKDLLFGKQTIAEWNARRLRVVGNASCIEKWSLTLENTRYAEHGRYLVPIEATARYEDIGREGHTAITRYVLKRKDVQVDKFSTQGFLDIPNGTPVELEEDEGNKYEWIDGRIVPIRKGP